MIFVRLNPTIMVSFLQFLFSESHKMLYELYIFYFITMFKI